jgi:hypothetical protein
MFVIMSELKFFSLTGVLIQNFKYVELVKKNCNFFLKKSKTSHLDLSGHVEGDTMQNHEQK